MLHTTHTRRLTLLSAVFLGAAGFGALRASAALTGIDNSSFETPAAGGTFADDGGIDKWSNFGPTWTLTTAQAHTGTQSVLNGATGGGLYQFDVADSSTGTYVEGRTFNYSFWAYNNNATGRLRVQFQGRNAINQTAGSLNVDATTTNTTVGVWTNFTGTFTTTIPSPALSGGRADRLAVTVTSQSGAGTWYLDDVTVSVVAPEPASLASLAIAGGLLRRRRRAL